MMVEAAAAEEAESMNRESELELAARDFIRKVKFYYGRGNSNTYDEFKELLLPPTGTPPQNNDQLLSGVRSLFYKAIFLTHQFKRFIPKPNHTINPSISKPKRKKLSPSQKKSLQDTMDFINKVQSTVDRTVFLKFVKEIMAYKKHDMASVRGVKKRKLLNLLKGYSHLKAGLSAILCDEDDTDRADLSFRRMLSARDAADKLKRENQNLFDQLEKQIDLTHYFSPLDFVCIKDQLQGSTVLPGARMMTRQLAVEYAMEISSELSRKIREVGSMRWTDDEMHKVQKFHMKEIDIPEWDWHSQLSEDKLPNLPPIEFYTRPKKGKSQGN